jgi:aspartyl/asparaginyl-tRNA synthetase
MVPRYPPLGINTHAGNTRLIMYLTGMENIRDVIPFPRTPRHAEF